MSETEILKELPKLTKTERQEIRLRLAELDGDDWLEEKARLTIHEKALLEARLAAYAKDPDAGDTWEEVESRIRTRLSRHPTDELK
ncbi:MAG: hypothetical protein LC794_06430 [Acidobacteria bacterium]|nr:hypothetical protein [Acidobacteriota bacterium]